jgi:hypothetical protein
MITTLRTGALTLDSVQYKFDSEKNLTIKLTTDGNHTLYGDVNIALSDVFDFTIFDESNTLIADFFNNTFLFSKTSDTTLEYTQKIQSGIDATEVFATLDPVSEGTISATVANSSFDLPAGNYNFLLLDSADSVFSGSKISIKMTNVGKTGVDGIASIFDENGEADVFSINNQDLQFSYPATVSLVDNNANVTNIPLIINN